MLLQFELIKSGNSTGWVLLGERSGAYFFDQFSKKSE